MRSKCNVLLLTALFLSLCIPAFADFGDEATIGGQDLTTQTYRWRVDSSGNLIPGKTASYDIGSSSLLVDAITASGAITYKTSLLTAGVGNGGVSVSIPTADTTLSPSCSVAFPLVCTKTLTIGDGTAEGQILTIVGKEQSDTGTLTISATTKTGWLNVSMDDDVGDYVTLMWTTTYGWIVIGQGDVTVNQM